MFNPPPRLLPTNTLYLFFSSEYYRVNRLHVQACARVSRVRRGEEKIKEGGREEEERKEARKVGARRREREREREEQQVGNKIVNNM